MSERVQKRRAELRMPLREYLANAGQRCPKCRSWDVRPWPRFEENEDGKVRRAVRCYECGHKYFEVYELKGWED